MFYRPSSSREQRQLSCLQYWNGWVAFQKKSWSEPEGAVLEQLSMFCCMVLIFFTEEARKPLREPSNRHRWCYLCTFCFVHESVCHRKYKFFACSGYSNSWAVECRLSTSRVILCFKALKICLWTASPERSHCLSARRFSCFKAPSCKATALYYGDDRCWDTLRCIVAACQSKRAPGDRSAGRQLVGLEWWPR